MYTDWSEEDRLAKVKGMVAYTRNRPLSLLQNRVRRMDFRYTVLGGDRFWGFDKNYFLLFKPFKGVQQERDKDFKA